MGRAITYDKSFVKLKEIGTLCPWALPSFGTFQLLLQAKSPTMFELASPLIISENLTSSPKRKFKTISCGNENMHYL